MLSKRQNHILQSIFVLAIYGAMTVTGFGQNAANPPDAAMVEKGKEIFSVACTGCHGGSHTSVQRKPAERWRKTIYTMISRGAPVLPGEVDPLNAFLAATYGPSSPLPTFGENGPRLPAQIPAGSEVVGRSCGNCHAVNLVFASKKSAEGWRLTIARMRANGAEISETEERDLVDYLGRNFAP